MTRDPLTLVLVCGGLGLIALGVLFLAVERLTRPNPGYLRRHDAKAAETREEWAEELGWHVVREDPPEPAWRTPSGSWRMPGRARHNATGGSAADTRSLHPGYYAAGRATVFQRPPRDEED
jgi:hypothetical protein